MWFCVLKKETMQCLVQQFEPPVQWLQKKLHQKTQEQTSQGKLFIVFTSIPTA